MAERASAAERRFWFAERVRPGAPAAIAFGRVRVDGPVREAELRAAVRAVVARHPALRTAFAVAGGDLVREERDVPRDVLRVLPAGTTPDRACGELAARPFDLAAGRVFRAALVPDGQGAVPVPGADLHLAVHHAVFDGLSEEVFTADLARAYGVALAGGVPALPQRPRLPAADPDDARAERLAAYWREALAGAGDLPDGGVGLGLRDLAEDRLVEAPLTCEPAPVREAARRLSCSPFAVLLAAYGRALAELTGVADFCVGTAVAVRPPGAEDEVGCALNMLPIRVRDPRGPGAVTRVWTALVGALGHADLPFDRIVAAARPGRGRRMPVYQASFAFQSWTRARHRAGPAVLRSVPVPQRGLQTELLLELRDEGERWRGQVQAVSRSWWATRLPDLAAAFRRALAETTTS
ncbi:condensation domain-containing protein [Actinosynnema sp. NPDC002837]